MNKNNKEIICINQEKGRVHDFKLYKESIGNKILKNIIIQVDSGYQGIKEYHENTEIPKKKSKNKELSIEDKLENQRISKERIVIENINAKIKVFKILANKYRNRRKRHGIRMSLICGIYNFELNK